MIAMVALLGILNSPDTRCSARVGFYQPSHGVISTPRIAAAVARLYLDAVYGEATITRELPLRVSLRREVWHVEGTLGQPAGLAGIGMQRIGGVAEIDLCQSTGQVLRIVHGK